MNPSVHRRSRAWHSPTWWAFSLLGAGFLGIAGCDAETRPADAGFGPDAGDIARIDAGAPDAGRDGDGGAGTDAGADADTAPSPGCFDGPVAVVDEGTRVVATTVHYRLEAEADAARASEWARLLEASYAQQITIFDGALTPASLPLRVKVFRDAASFRAGLSADGIGAVGEAGGYYEPSNETAYLAVQPTRYYTQVLLVHEAVHQIHDLTRAAPSLPFWYIEGIAEALSRHDWDGRCARLATRPLLSQEDTPLAARTELASGGPSLADVVSGAIVALTPGGANGLPLSDARRGRPPRARVRRFSPRRRSRHRADGRLRRGLRGPHRRRRRRGAPSPRRTRSRCPWSTSSGPTWTRRA